MEPDPETEIETESEPLATTEVLAGVTLTVGVVFEDPGLPPPPQPIPVKVRATVSNKALRIFLDRRKGPGMKNKSSAAIAVPPAASYHLELLLAVACMLELDAFVVPTVIVPAPLAADAMVTLLPVRVIPSLEGPVAVSVTVPV